MTKKRMSKKKAGLSAMPIGAAYHALTGRARPSKNKLVAGKKILLMTKGHASKKKAN